MGAPGIPNYEDDFDDEFDDRPEPRSMEPLQSNRSSVQRFPAVSKATKKPRNAVAPQRASFDRKASMASQNLSQTGKRSLGSTANKSMKLPPVRLSKSDMMRTTTSDVNGRILSAKARRVQDLESERNFLRNEVAELRREIRVLNQTTRRQGRALIQYEGKDEEASFIKVEEEGRILREHLRVARHKYAQIRELNRQLEIHSVAVEKERDRLAALVRDGELLDLKHLKDERDDLAGQLAETESKIKDLERINAHLTKANDRSQNATIARLKQQLGDYRSLTLEPVAKKREPRKTAASKVESRSSSLANRQPQPAPSKSDISGQRKALKSQQTAKSTAPSVRENTNQKREDLLAGELQSPENESVSSEITNQPVNRWKTRTSPDLLRDHGQQTSSSTALASDQNNEVGLQQLSPVPEPVAKPTLKSSSDIRETLLARLNSLDRKRSSGDFAGQDLLAKDVDSEKLMRGEGAKNELLDKIRSLRLGNPGDSDKPADDAQLHRDAVTGPSKSRVQFQPLAASQIRTESLTRSSHSSNLVSDDEMEEIEYFN